MFLLPLVPPLAAAVLAQLFKVLGSLGQGQFSWHVLRRYGGMPSSHSALVVGLVTQAILTDGWGSVTTALAVALAILTIRDATGFRRTLGRYATTLNRLVAQLPAQQQASFTYLDEVVGHTPSQALVGALIGAGVVWLWPWF